MNITVSIESVDESAVELAQWLKTTIRKKGYTKYVHVATSNQSTPLPEIIFFLDCLYCLNDTMRRLRRKYLTMIRRDPTRYVVIDGTLSLEEQRETIWLALRAKLSRQGVHLCQEVHGLRIAETSLLLSSIG